MRGQNITLLIARIPPKVMLLAVTSLALAAGVLVESEMQKKDKLLKDQQASTAHKDLSQVLVAARDIPEGMSISADALRLDTVESSRIPMGALQDTGSALGLQAKSTIHAGDSILFQNLQSHRKIEGFEAKIRSGYRAITFPVDASTGVAGFLVPDCHVDILAQSGSGAEAKAVPILSDVQVVAVNQTYQRPAGQSEAQPSSCVTVAVVPADGQKLINAMSSGKLYCLMRSQMDHSPLAVRDISSVFPKAKPIQSSEPELSSLPSLPAIPQAVSSEREVKIPNPPPLHNVDIWSASKKDALVFPQE